VGVVLSVLGGSGLSQGVHPLGWEEPGALVGAHVDGPPVVVDEGVVSAAEEDQVGGVVQLGRATVLRLGPRRDAGDDRRGRGFAAGPTRVRRSAVVSPVASCAEASAGLADRTRWDFFRNFMGWSRRSCRIVAGQGVS